MEGEPTRSPALVLTAERLRMNTIHSLFQSLEKAQELLVPGTFGTGCEACLSVCAGVKL